jgi:hypothetical protein
MTGTGTFTTVGNPTKTTILQSERSKLSIEFVASGAIKKGQLVKLTTDGKVIVWAKADLQHLCLGIALSDQLDGELITISTRAYAMIWGMADGVTNTGPGTVNGYNTANAALDGGAKGYNRWGAATDVTDAVGWIIDQGAAQYNLMRVLIKD